MPPAAAASKTTSKAADRTGVPGSKSAAATEAQGKLEAENKRLGDVPGILAGDKAAAESRGNLGSDPFASGRA